MEDAKRCDLDDDEWKVIFYFSDVHSLELARLD